MRIAIIGGILLCAAFHHTADAKVRNASKADLQAVRADMIKDEVENADSAEFRNVRIVDVEDGGEMMCGEVNVKNSRGAYAGYAKFVAAYVKGVAYVIGIENDETTSVSELCASMGL